MGREGDEQIEQATWLLEHERGGDVTSGTSSAARVFDKLERELSPLVGAAGVQALFMRSAKLCGGELAELSSGSIFSGAAKLRDRLGQEPSRLDREQAIALFATFLSLLTTFIGARLTRQVLRSAWPTLELRVRGETKP